MVKLVGLHIKEINKLLLGIDISLVVSFGSGNAVCESVAVIPTDETEYEVYVIIKRTINGATKRYIEVLNTF